MENNTSTAYFEIIDKCKEIFLKKNQDYGRSWTIMRLSSLTDQIFIKAKRIRTIQETNQNLIGDSQEDEFMSIINYSIMAMMLSGNHSSLSIDDMSLSSLKELYETIVFDTHNLMVKKNTDYGEVWRDMRVSSMTDLMLSKILRIKQIEDNQGQTIISEGIYSNYQDIMNYAIFCIIQLSDSKQV